MTNDEHKAQLAFTAAPRSRRNVQAQPDYGPAMVRARVSMPLSGGRKRLRKAVARFELLPWKRPPVDGPLISSICDDCRVLVKKISPATACHSRRPLAVSSQLWPNKTDPFWDPFAASRASEKSSPLSAEIISGSRAPPVVSQFAGIHFNVPGFASQDVFR